MSKILPLTLQSLLACLLAVWVGGGTARAETYHWVDSQGNMHFSDNPASVPQSKKVKVRVSNDITTSNSDVRTSLEESRKRAAAIEWENQDKARQWRVREVKEEQERRIREANEKKFRAEQAKHEQQAAEDLKRRLSTAPIQTYQGGGSFTRSVST